MSVFLAGGIFESLMHTPEKLIFVPDLHGHDELLRATHQVYGDDVRYLIMGDVVDGTDRVRQTLDIMLDIDSRMLVGNHEWAMLAAIFERRNKERQQWRDDIWLRRYQLGTLDSYSVNDRYQPATRALKLGQALLRHGHLDLLQNAALFYEDDEHVAIHAGLTNYTWSAQKDALLEAERAFRQNHFRSEPVQLFDHDHTIARKATTLKSLGKIIISGHSNLTLSADDRVTDKGRRVRLGSRLHLGDPLFVYESWTGQVRAIQAD